MDPARSFLKVQRFIQPSGGRRWRIKGQAEVLKDRLAPVVNQPLEHLAPVADEVHVPDLADGGLQCRIAGQHPAAALAAAFPVQSEPFAPIHVRSGASGQSMWYIT